MNYKVLSVIVILLSSLFVNNNVKAMTAMNEKVDKISIVYVTDNNDITENVYLLDVLVSRFAQKTDLYSIYDVTKGTFKNSDVVILVSEINTLLPKQFLKEFNQFNGNTLVLGYNGEQLDRFNDWKFADSLFVQTIGETILNYQLEIIDFQCPTEAELFATATHYNDEVPFIVKDKNSTFIASGSILNESKDVIARYLPSLLQVKAPDYHPAYIAINEITPKTDYNNLKQIASYFAEHKMPFYLFVTPIFVNYETMEKIYLSDNEQLVEVLIELQSLGGIVVANGLTASYRQDDDFEFWDQLLNQQITTSDIEEIPALLKERTRFSQEDEFASYLETFKKNEQQYFDYKLTESIEQLVDLKLFPLGFKVPYDATSISGYKIISDYFSILFGNVQLSNYKQLAISETFFISKPTILSGMELYPLTLGNIVVTEDDPFLQIKENISALKKIPGSVISGTYPAYLGDAHIQQYINLIAGIPNVEWLNLSTKNIMTKTKNIVVEQSDSNGLVINNNLTKLDYFIKDLKANPFEYMLWLLVIIVGMFLALFFIYVINLRFRLRKRLFEERA